MVKKQRIENIVEMTLKSEIMTLFSIRQKEKQTKKKFRVALFADKVIATIF